MAWSAGPLALALLLPARASAEFSCPVFGPAAVSEGDARYASKPVVDCAFKFIGGKAAGANSCRTPHITARRTLLASHRTRHAARNATRSAYHLTPHAARFAVWSGKTEEVSSPVFNATTGARAVIGTIPTMGADEALEAVRAAATAWDRGQGQWPRMPLAKRIAAIEGLVLELKAVRAPMVEVLEWEIAKTSADAAAEFDRTMQFIAAVIAELRRDPNLGQGLTGWTTLSGVGVRMRRGPLGVMLGLAPFNYPLNEMYAMLIPALLMGNTVVLKLPSIGGLVHCLTAAAFAKALPPGVINFVAGSGRATMAPIMQSGLVDVLGFIGGAKGVDALIKEHPQPHRLKVFSQLEAKNLGIVLPDADLDAAAATVATGALAYNGQRCTAIKLVMVHDSVAESFVQKLLAEVAKKRPGLPWEEAVTVTPLPEPTKPKYLEELIADALGKGASLANRDGGGGGLRGALFTPAVVDGVTPGMRLFSEEQFGPVVPIARFSDVAEVHKALRDSWNGQQAALFTSSAETAAPLVDALSTIVGRININAQCGRSPDAVPFSGRRSSAMGTMSVTEVLRAFSIETVVAYQAKDAASAAVAAGLDSRAAFFAPLD